MELILFYFAWAVVVGIIASSRGRNGFGWFLLSCFITPFLMTLLVLCLPRLERTTTTTTEPIVVRQRKLIEM